MTDDQHEEGAARGASRWDPLPQGDYDDGATAFVQLPEGGIDALLAAADSPLAAPGHGYVPPRITAMPAAEQAAEPAPGGGWGDPAGQDAGPWPDPAAAAGHPGHDDRFTYRPDATGQWDTRAAAQQPPAPGHDVTGQWSIPVAGGELPDESGEFTTSALVEQWGGNPPATLPGGAAAPWASEGAEEPWAQRDGERSPGAEGRRRPVLPDPYRPAGHPPAEHPHEADGTGTYELPDTRPPFGGQDTRPAPPAPQHPSPQAPGGPPGRGYDDTGHLSAADPYATSAGTPGGYGSPSAPGTEDPYADAPRAEAAYTEVPYAEDPYAEDPYADGRFEESPATAVHGSAAADGHPAGTAGAPEPHEAAGGPAEAAAPAPAAVPPGADPGTPPPAEPPADGFAPGTPGSPDAPDAEAAAEAAGPEEDPPAEVPAAGPAPAPPHDEHPLASYVLSVNGVDRPVTDAWVGESLLYVLRERLGLAGAKDGCSQGECGACNVQVDGRLVASCLVPAVTAAGSEVRTVEGLAADGRPSDVQRALARCGAVQCGFCVPGMAMTVHDLLEGNPAPSERETRQALCGNLCRCSGYRGILDAVNEVVAERDAHNAAAHATDTAEPRIPHQAGPGDGGVNTSAFDGAEPHEQSYGQDGGQA